MLSVSFDDCGSLVHGDVREIGLPDKSVDAAVMCRLSRWLSPEDCQAAMRQLQRVTTKRIIWTARVANHVHARSVDLFEQALDGWRITRNEAGSDIDYRVMMAEPV
jgi:ubiquinone/menaquinone biosynthesis C-methylase UbiE